MKRMDNMVPLCITVPSTLKREIQDISDKSDLSVGQYLRRVLRNHMTALAKQTADKKPS